MNATAILFQPEDTMNRPFDLRPPTDAHRTRFSAAATVAGSAPNHRLPPTRAARPTRSRGVFFGSRRSRLGQWIATAVCVALVSLSVVASAHFAEPAFDAAAISANVGPELLASATRTPSFLAARVR
ncbi:MAG TPA: hypothetical protein VG429_11410 [Casimicrobiaceae bacterium]|jgi:hypothetical protein|nr:hypothetical protein [Casimicrobiaceae bacterium]